MTGYGRIKRKCPAPTCDRPFVPMQTCPHILGADDPTLLDTLAALGEEMDAEMVAS